MLLNKDDITTALAGVLNTTAGFSVEPCIQQFRLGIPSVEVSDTEGMIGTPLYFPTIGLSNFNWDDNDNINTRRARVFNLYGSIVVTTSQFDGMAISNLALSNDANALYWSRAGNQSNGNLVVGGVLNTPTSEIYYIGQYFSNHYWFFPSGTELFISGTAPFYYQIPGWYAVVKQYAVNNSPGFRYIGSMSIGSVTDCYYYGTIISDANGAASDFITSFSAPLRAPELNGIVGRTNTKSKSNYPGVRSGAGNPVLFNGISPYQAPGSGNIGYEEVFATFSGYKLVPNSSPRSSSNSPVTFTEI